MTQRLGKNCRKLSLAALAVAILATHMGAEAHAAVGEPNIDQARMCTMHFPRNERVHGIPTHLLAAIASTESGRWSDTLGMVIPWPWTLNADGKGYYFNSKAEAVAKVKELQRKGANNIDVGCMQVSMKHHKHAFRSVEQALDPQYNVAYAAKFLRSNYDDLRSWTKATAAYHSRTPRYGNVYLTRVEKSWNGIVGKVREARAKRGLSSGQYATRVAERERQFAALSEEFATTELKATETAIVSPARATRPRNTVKVIQVHDKPSQRKERTLVIRPKTSPAGTVALKSDSGAALQTVASVSSDLFVTQYGDNKTTTRKLSAASSSTETAPKLTGGPKFVFVE
jgi:hypothetical protein